MKLNTNLAHLFLMIFFFFFNAFSKFRTDALCFSKVDESLLHRCPSRAVSLWPADKKQCTYILTYESCSSAFTKRETARLRLWISQGLRNCGRSASSSVKELWSSCKVQNLEMFDGKKQVSSESLDVEF